jgi:hypothetical protein
MYNYTENTVNRTKYMKPNLVLKGLPVSGENVFQIRKFEPSVPFLVAMIAAKDTKCVSFPNLALSMHPYGINGRFSYV